MAKLALGVMVGSLLAPVAAVADEWRDLFDGKSFAGWEFDIKDHAPPELTYSIVDGMLNIAGKDRAVAVVRTKRDDFREYELKFEWRWPDEPGNSGCLIHASFPRYKNVWPKSLEIQMQSGNAGDFIHIGETIDVPLSQFPTDLSGRNSWKVRLRNNLTDDSENQPGEWNRAHIKVKGGAVTVHINGVLVNHGTGLSTASGAICFQAEGANVQYRNIKILETE
ncbi:MAG: hypothetical protein SynsKO_30440 [Synoicihabitans sp.]